MPSFDSDMEMDQLEGDALPGDQESAFSSTRLPWKTPVVQLQQEQKQQKRRQQKQQKRRQQQQEEEFDGGAGLRNDGLTAALAQSPADVVSCYLLGGDSDDSNTSDKGGGSGSGASGSSSSDGGNGSSESRSSDARADGDDGVGSAASHSHRPLCQEEEGRWILSWHRRRVHQRGRATEARTLPSIEMGSIYTDTTTNNDCGADWQTRSSFSTTTKGTAKAATDAMAYQRQSSSHGFRVVSKDRRVFAELLTLRGWRVVASCVAGWLVLRPFPVQFIKAINEAHYWYHLSQLAKLRATQIHGWISARISDVYHNTT